MPSEEEMKKFKEESVEKKMSPSFGKIFSFKHLSSFIKEITKAYFNRYLSEASKQSYSTSPVLFESEQCTPFNQSKDEIFFLTSDFKSTPALRRFDKKSQKWTHQKIDLPLGKVFKINNEYYSRSSEYTAPNTIHYSLFSKGLKNNKTFDSKYVTDIRGDSVLYIDAKNNLESFKLYLNDKFYAKVHSSALLDKNGNIYYFKQKDSRRTLYKNKSPLFSYKGYYGKLLEIDSKGSIYFIGASRFGSSIYRYRSGKISRASSSDTVIQAQKINNKEFIVCEVTPYKYEYKTAPHIITNERPVFYKYHFKKTRPSFAKRPADQKTKKRNAVKIKSNESSQISKQKSSGYKPYSGLKKLRFAGGNAFGLSTGLYSSLGGSLIFSDYLMRHLIQVIGMSFFDHWWSRSDKFLWKNPINFINLVYSNKTYRLTWNLGYSVFDWNLFEKTHVRCSSGYLSLRYPLMKEGRWSSSFSSQHFVGKTALSEYSSTSEEKEDNILYQSRGKFYTGYSQKFPFNYSLSNESAELQVFLDHKYKQSGDMWNGLKGGVIGEASLHTGRDFYWITSASYASSLNADVNPVETNAYVRTYPKGFDKKEISPMRSNIVTDDTTLGSFVIGDVAALLLQNRYLAKSIGTASIGMKKTFSINPSNLFTASFRSRYLFFEKLTDTRMAALTLPKGQNVQNIQPHLDSLINAVDVLDSEKDQEYFSEYTHWLEWTFGLEYLQLIPNLTVGGIIIGWSFGFRTPVKFWERETNGSETKDPVVHNLANDSALQRTLPAQQRKTSSLPFISSLNPSFQMHIKMPF